MLRLHVLSVLGILGLFASPMTAAAQSDEAVRQYVWRSIDQLGSEDAEVRANAVAALVRLARPEAAYRETVGVAVAGLIETLRDRDAATRATVARVLGAVVRGARCRSGPELAIPLLIHALSSDPDPDVRAQSARTLGSIGLYLDDTTALRPAVEPLVTALDDGGESVDCSRPGTPRTFRTDREAAAALTVIAPRVQDGAALVRALPFLVDALVDPDPRVRSSSESALQAALIGVAHDDTVQTVISASYEALAPGDPAQPVLAEFLARLDDPRYHGHREAVFPTGSDVRALLVGDATSYYLQAGPSPPDDGVSLPAIICIGHPVGGPEFFFSRVRGQFDASVLCIWSGLLIVDRPEWSGNIDDPGRWAEKSKQFPQLIDAYLDSLDINPDRIYLTGFSSDAVYAWMLAYDRPERYAGVVAMSSVSYPVQIKENIERASDVVTVVVRGNLDHLPDQVRQDDVETGRRIEAVNPNSRWILMEGETHSSVVKAWVEQLRYILQFRRGGEQIGVTPHGPD